MCERVGVKGCGSVEMEMEEMEEQRGRGNKRKNIMYI